ncbi:hypothetical protein ACNFD4_17315 [Pseudomonas sp. NY15367]
MNRQPDFIRQQDKGILRELTRLGLPLQVMYIQRLTGFGYERSLEVMQRLQEAGLGNDQADLSGVCRNIECYSKFKHDGGSMMTEKELEDILVARISGPACDLSGITIEESTSAAGTLKDLCGNTAFTVFKDTSDWNLQPKAMPDVIGGMTPDIVLRSQVSGQNRIYIEVKEAAFLSYGRYDSQVVRYFLHLLASTERKPAGKDDIGRAILLAAPTYWFEQKTGGDWLYFVEKYTGLARAFNITLGKIVLDSGRER